MLRGTAIQPPLVWFHARHSAPNARTHRAHSHHLTGCWPRTHPRPGDGKAEESQGAPRRAPLTPVVKFMRYVVASGLGVTCSFCHGAPNVPFDSIDFASDERPTKRTAREMLRMVARSTVVSCCRRFRTGARRRSRYSASPATADFAAAHARGYAGDGDRPVRARLRACDVRPDQAALHGPLCVRFRAALANTLATRLIEQNKLPEAQRMLELNIREHPTPGTR